MIIYKDESWTVEQQAPTSRSVKICSPRLGSCGIYRDYFLSFPYIIFARGTSDRCYFQVGFSKTPQQVKNIEEIQFYIPPLPNLYDNGEVCLGDYPARNHDLQTLIDLFWQTEFSEVEDPCWEMVEVACQLFKNDDPYALWEEMSKNDPDFVFNVNWGELLIGLGDQTRPAVARAVQEAPALEC